MFEKKLKLPTPQEALKGRAEKMPVPPRHDVLDTPLGGPFPAGLETAMFALGCFWGAEKKFWQLPGVYTTAVGYAAGLTPNPTYREVCSGMTGHAEVVLVVFDPKRVSYEELHTVPIGHLLLQRCAAYCGRAIPRRLSTRAVEGRLRSYHHRNHRGPRVLLRRGLPSAVPLEESERLLRPWWNRRVLPGRRERRRVSAAQGIAAGGR
jgi:hypothetical protein